MRGRTGLDFLKDLDLAEEPLAVSCKHALAELKTQCGGPDCFPPWRDLAVFARRKAQSFFSKKVDKNLQASLLESLDVEGKVRVRSCGGPLASGWQTASPSSLAGRMTDDEYSVTARALLGQQLVATAGSRCRNRRLTRAAAGTECGVLLDSDARHCYCCAVGGGLKTRSTAVVAAIERCHRQCGLSTAREVHVAQWDRWKWSCQSPACSNHGVAETRPSGACPTCGGDSVVSREEAVLDLEVRGPEVPVSYLDVCVHHSVPCDAVRLLKASKADGEVAKEAARTKHTRYPAHRSQWRMVPLAFETFGRLGREGLEYLRTLARQAAARVADDGEVDPSALLSQFGCSVSVALQRANVANIRKSVGPVFAVDALLLAEAT